MGLWPPCWTGQWWDFPVITALLESAGVSEGFVTLTRQCSQEAGSRRGFPPHGQLQQPLLPYLPLLRALDFPTAPLPASSVKHGLPKDLPCPIPTGVVQMRHPSKDRVGE